MTYNLVNSSRFEEVSGSEMLQSLHVMRLDKVKTIQNKLKNYGPIRRTTHVRRL